jgi:hypothetical protein
MADDEARRRGTLDAMRTLTVRRTLGLTRTVVGPVLMCLHPALTAAAFAQRLPLPPADRDARFGPNRITLDIGILAAALSYARQLSPTAEWGVAVSGVHRPASCSPRVS